MQLICFIILQAASATLAFHTTTPHSNVIERTGHSINSQPFINSQKTLLENLRPPSAFAAVDLTAPPMKEREEVIITRGVKREGVLMDLTKSSVDPFSARIILDEIRSVEQDTGTEVQVVVADDVDYKNYNPKQFATMLFNDWEVGPADKNNGVLILVVLKQRRVEIEVGKGLNSYMGKEWCSNLLEKETLPAFKVEQYGRGLANTVQIVAKRLRDVDAGIAKKGFVREKNMKQKVDRFFDQICFSVAFSALASIGAAEVYENKYPLGTETICNNCGGRDWKISNGKRVEVSGISVGSDGYETKTTGDGWEIVEQATDKKEGKKRLPCQCKNCGNLMYKTKPIRKYDGKKIESDGTCTFYYNSSSSRSGSRSSGSGGGGGGGSSSGGGGGASW